jgi:L-lactate dehydrogenase
VSNSAFSEATKAVVRRKETCSQAGHARSVAISERAPSRTARVAVVGTGFVGATTAFGLLLSDVPADLVLVNRDKQLAEGHADDFRDAQAFGHASRILVGGLSDCRDADIVVVTVGLSQSNLRTSRFEDLTKTAEIFRDLIPRIAAENPFAVIVVASNPVDVLTYAAWKWSGFPSHRVLGSGTRLDTSRLRRRLGAFFGVAPPNVHAYVIGEHGDSQVAVFSSAQLAGVPLKDFCRRENPTYSDTSLQTIADASRAGGFKILRAKGATYYGIAAALVRIVRSILRDERAILTVSSLVPDALELGEVCLSLPAIVGRAGIDRVIPPILAPDEERALKASAAIIRQYILGIGSVASAEFCRRNQIATSSMR